MTEYPRVSEETPCADCGFIGAHLDVACAARVCTMRMAELTTATERLADRFDALVVELKKNIAPRRIRARKRGGER